MRGEPRLQYDEFKDVVRRTAERRSTQGSLVPIPELRRDCPSLDRPTFDDFVLALHREGLIHLLSHVEPEKLSEEARGGCMSPASGPLLYWVRWL